MTLDIKRTAGRPKKLPDIMPELERAIKEWEGEQTVNVDLKVEHSVSHSWFHAHVNDWFIFTMGKVGGVILIYVIILFIIRRI